jgi:hypothetical protein
MKAKTANERAYSALTLTCSEAKLFRVIYNSKQLNYQVEVRPLLAQN